MSNSENIPSKIIQYLGQKTGIHYRGSKPSLSNIRARLREGATLSEAKLVIDYKVEEWSETEMEKYLRPSTLFRPSHFDEYLGLAKRWEARGRPKIRKRKQSEIGQRLNQRGDVYTEFMTGKDIQRKDVAPLTNK